MIQPQDMGTTVSSLAMLYKHSFGLNLPPINHDLILYSFISQLALPLDIYPAVQNLAEAAHLDFHYPTSKSPKRRQASFPELQLMALITIAVKLLYPLDSHSLTPDTQSEPTALKIDWSAWAKLHPPHSTPSTDKAPLPRGSEIDLRDTDVFDLSAEKVDAYMDWYQRTWVRPPALGDESLVAKEILNLFPLLDLADQTKPSTQPNTTHDQAREKEISEKIKSATAGLQYHPPTTNAPHSQARPPRKPGQGYTIYPDEESLLSHSPAATTFHRVAAEVAATTVANLILAVRHVEAQIGHWKGRRRREEVGLDLAGVGDGTEGGGGAEIDATGGGEVFAVDEEGLELSESDEDMQMI